MKHKLMTSTIASLMFVAGAAVAADPTPVSVSGGTIHFEGKLVNAACAVSTKSADQTVTLGQYRTASFTTTATGVGIEILDNTSSPLKPDGATFSAKQSLVEGTNTLRFTARYKATAAATTPGQANADATFIMKYE